MPGGPRKGMVDRMDSVMWDSVSLDSDSLDSDSLDSDSLDPDSHSDLLQSVGCSAVGSGSGESNTRGWEKTHSMYSSVKPGGGAIFLGAIESRNSRH